MDRVYIQALEQDNAFYRRFVHKILGFIMCYLIYTEGFFHGLCMFVSLVIATILV